MKLLALQCPDCGANLIPEDQHIVSPCPNCHIPVLIDEAGLSKMPLTYAVPQTGKKVVEWQPFWIFHGKVNITRRDTQGGSKSARKDAEQLWGYPRYLYVPAWDLNVDYAQSIGSHLAERQPVYHPLENTPDLPLTPVAVSAKDALKLAEFIVLAIEARRDDWLKRLEFTLEMNSPELWALPADIDGLVALTGSA